MIRSVLERPLRFVALASLGSLVVESFDDAALAQRQRRRLESPLVDAGDAGDAAACERAYSGRGGRAPSERDEIAMGHCAAGALNGPAPRYAPGRGRNAASTKERTRWRSIRRVLT